MFLGLFVNASGAVKKTDFRPNLKAVENWKYTNCSYFSSLSIGSKVTIKIFSQLTVKWEKLSSPCGVQLKQRVSTVFSTVTFSIFKVRN